AVPNVGTRARLTGDMEDGLRLPWWEFRPTDFTLPGTVEPPDSCVEERLLAGFLQAGARAETADFFISAHSLNVAGVLDALSQEELVLSAPPREAAEATGGGSVDVPDLPQVGCRSRLLGMPLADRHAALTAACSLRHRLPRRALVNFLCRLVLGKDVGRLPAPSSSLVETDGHCLYPVGHEGSSGGRSWETEPSNDSCACGEQTRRSAKRPMETQGSLSGPSTDTMRSKRAIAPGGAMGDMPGVPMAAEDYLTAVCRSCFARRKGLDSCSVQLLVVACSQLLWDKTLPEDEGLALRRCLSALSQILGHGDSGDDTQSRGRGDRATATGGESRRAGAGTSLPPAAARPARARVGISALLAGVRRRRCQTGEPAAGVGVDRIWKDASRAALAAAAAGGAASSRRRPRTDAEETEGLKESTPSLGPGKKKIARGEGDRSSLLCPEEEPRSPVTPASVGEKAPSVGSVAEGGLATAARTASETTAAVAVSDRDVTGALTDGRSSSSRNVSEVGETEHRQSDCLAPAIREQMAAVAEKVAAAGARGATSSDVQGAVEAAVSFLQEAVKSPSNFTPSAASARADRAHLPSSSSSQQPPQQRQQQPLEAACSGLGLHVSRGKGALAPPAAAAEVPTAGCGDDVVMAVCDGFVTPALSLKNCLAFVRAVLVPRARALTTPASRLLVTAVSGIGKQRPGVVIDGLILPLLCEGDLSMVGSAQCELCTRLIKQVLPKHALEAVLVGLCDPLLDESTRASAGAWGGVPQGGGAEAASSSPSSCVWTELTTPVITAALNLKPTLSDKAIAALVRGVEAAAEQPNLQKSLKFTTLIHSMVNRFGPQLKPHVPTLRAAVGRCSNFMVKAVLAALQRLDR
ncbi:unnamed protein product, partial [Scytosiphon promiscuus]